MNMCSQLTNHLSLTNTTISSICLFALLGCDARNTAPRPAQQEHLISREIPVVSGAGLQNLVQQDELVLVEFGVNFGCVRCDDMRPQVARLADEFEGQAKVVRVDFNANRGLAAQLGANICPSYVLFQRGKVVVTRSYPTSADLLTADLDAARTRNHEHSTPTVNGN